MRMLLPMPSMAGGVDRRGGYVVIVDQLRQFSPHGSLRRIKEVTVSPGWSSFWTRCPLLCIPSPDGVQERSTLTTLALAYLRARVKVYSVY